MSRWLVPLVCCIVASGCGREQGVSCSGTVRFDDSSPVANGEIWLEPDDPMIRDRRPQRAPIAAGAFRFPPAAGIVPGRWVARIYPPPLGSISTADDIASSFEDSHEPVVIDDSKGGADGLHFTVRRRGGSGTQ